MSDVLCPRCRGRVAERVNATTVQIEHAGRTTTITGGWVSTTCGRKLPPDHRRTCRTRIVLQGDETDVLE